MAGEGGGGPASGASPPPTPGGRAGDGWAKTEERWLKLKLYKMHQWKVQGGRASDWGRGQAVKREKGWCEG